MDTKFYLSEVLVLLAFLFFGFSGNAQSSSDTIRMVKKGSGIAYYKDSEMLNLTQVIQLTSSHKEAVKLLEQSRNMRNITYIFAPVGGFCLGYSVGHLIGTAIFGTAINQPLFFAMLGAGVVFTGITIALEAGSNNKARMGIALFNQSVKQKNNISLDLGFSPGGMLLKLNL